MYSQTTRSITGILPLTARITARLQGSSGFLVYSLDAKPTVKRVWTLCRDEASLRDFVHTPPHIRAITELAPHMGATAFIRRTLNGLELPARWEEALISWRWD